MDWDLVLWVRGFQTTYLWYWRLGSWFMQNVWLWNVYGNVSDTKGRLTRQSDTHPYNINCNYVGTLFKTLKNSTFGMLIIVWKIRAKGLVLHWPRWTTCWGLPNLMVLFHFNLWLGFPPTSYQPYGFIKPSTHWEAGWTSSGSPVNNPYWHTEVTDGPARITREECLDKH